MGLGALCLILLYGLIGSHAQPPCSLITPGVLRVDSEETIVVDGHGNEFNAEITIKNYPRREFVLARSQVSVNSRNQFLSNAKMKISSENMEKDPNKKVYVYVTLSSNVCSLEKVVLVSFQSGYIFIQTDKPIYTPGSTVLYRIFTVDPNLRPVRKQVVIEFVTPENIIIKKDVFQQTSKTGIMSQSHPLPNVISLGLWTISAKFDETLIQNFTTQFEVKEYVLPSFEIKLTPSQNFFYFNDKTLEVKIEANYLHGKPVYGKAFVLFGVMKGDEKNVIPATLKSEAIINGEGSASLNRTDLVKYLKKEEDMLDWRLYVSVTVITDSGSDMLEATLENIFIVKSPYKIHFTKTSKYFKPGMPFNLKVFVTNPDGTPANKIPIEVEGENSNGLTLTDGTVQITLNTQNDQKKMQMKVSTTDTKLSKDQQASATMEAFAYEPTIAGNYLHLSFTGEMKPGGAVSVNFNIGYRDTNVQSQINQFNYVIMNKGRILKVGTQERKKDQNPVAMSLSITEEFIPSFRILAYYTVTVGAVREIVSDSVWVDVGDDCMGTLAITGEKLADNAVQNPGGRVSLKLQADHNAAVGLVAVDKGVYVINNKLKISQKKIWGLVEKFDIGCTPGSGANTPGVFYDAGLALHTSFTLTSPQRTELSCQRKLKRRPRSSALLLQEQDKKASQYTGDDKKCCQDGMHKNPMGHSCERRSRNILNGQKCVAAFLDCCRHIKQQKERERELKEKDKDSRSSDDSDFLDFGEVTTRSHFHESWLWEVKIMNEKPDKGISTKIFNIFLKESITTWEVLAVSLSENKGICVSQPHNIQVQMSFFIDLKLPYSVVRNEQVEIRAVLYNYRNDRIKVRVEWTHNENFCSLSTSKKNHRQEFWIEPSSSVTAPFVIMPLILGVHDIEVKAVSQFVSDGVRKPLKVVPEGRLVPVILKSVVLNPQLRGGTQDEQITIVDFKNVVPDTKINTIITIQGTPISELLEKSTDGAKLNHLIRAPDGCAEQNMMKTTAPLIATQYLDFSRQWERLGLHKREEAIAHIRSGVAQQIPFKKPDGSYGTWEKTPSSTWLTAYVVKVFSLASDLVDVDKNLICDSVKWLILNKQNPDGEFREDAPVYHQEMVGGIKKEAAERDSTLTAFVLIALLASNKTCNDLVGNLPGSMNGAIQYINDNYPYLQKPYSIAITSYALAKANKLPDIKKLMSASTDNKYWEETDSRLLSVEATSYALLALLKMKASTDKTGPLVKWITEQRHYGETYDSTQSTMMQFEALAQYQIDAPGVKDLEMDVSFKLSEKSDGKSIRLDLKNALIPRSEESNEPRNFTVTAKGKGQGSLKVTSMYYAIETESEKKCNNFNLTVTIKDEPDVKKPEGVKTTVSMNICVKYLRKQDATMSIIDITLMTGFAPDTNELNQLKNGVDKYISRYEINKGAFDRGTLVLYLDKVSHTEEECLAFNLHQYFDVGLIQPGSVTVYDYYSPERRCTKFYHVDEKSKLQGKICVGEVCRCAEGNCYLQQRLEKVTALARVNMACAPGVDYAYKATLEKIEDNNNYYNYIMKIKTLIKKGTDIVTVNDRRHFISHAKCKEALKLKVGLDYVIWGMGKDLWSISSSEYAYLLTKDTWIEMWPNDRECHKDEYFDLCEEFENFTGQLEVRGCLK